MSMDNVKGRLDRLEAGPARKRTFYDYSDEELIEIARLDRVWPDLTEPEKDRLLVQLSALGPELDRMADEEHDRTIDRLIRECRS